jgi:hypothetical protein
MVDTIPVNGAAAVAAPATVLPDLIHLTAAEARRIPSPGAQRELKAQTGRSFDQLCGPDAEGADRHQTLIWMKLRRDFPGLRWDDCAEVTVEVDDDVALAVDPTKLSDFVTSPPSAGSGD